jgi:hypothetical protein
MKKLKTFVLRLLSLNDTFSDWKSMSHPIFLFHPSKSDSIVRV